MKFTFFKKNYFFIFFHFRFFSFLTKNLSFSFENFQFLFSMFQFNAQLRCKMLLSSTLNLKKAQNSKHQLQCFQNFNFFLLLFSILLHTKFFHSLLLSVSFQLLTVKDEENWRNETKNGKIKRNWIIFCCFLCDNFLKSNKKYWK